MLHSFKGFHTFLACAGGLVALFLAHAYKMVPIVGSLHSFFSLSDALMPLTGVLGLGAGAIAALARSGLSFMVTTKPLLPLVYHLPGFCASASWAYRNKLMRCALPVACMVLFWIHPIGFYAAPYALYWLIPVAIYASKKKGIFLEALSATFIAHAVGSVVWLYAKALPVAVWWGLIPVVPFERLLNAAVMTVAYYGIRELGRTLYRLRVYQMVRRFVIHKD